MHTRQTAKGVDLTGAKTSGKVWLAALLAALGTFVVGSVLVFTAARKWGEPLVIRLVGEEKFYKYSGRLDREGWWLFAILLVPLVPDDAVCALAGLSAVTFGRFLVFMVVGRLPGPR